MAAAAPSLAPAPSPSPATAPKAGDRKVVPLTAADEVELEEKHVLAVDDSSVDRAVIAKILRSSKYRGKHQSLCHRNLCCFLLDGVRIGRLNFVPESLQ
jgi:hypothetical protein